eukprot:3702479-Alexandrium_andersonii.AAC.1
MRILSFLTSGHNAFQERPTPTLTTRRTGNPRSRPRLNPRPMAGSVREGHALTRLRTGTTGPSGRQP